MATTLTTQGEGGQWLTTQTCLGTTLRIKLPDAPDGPDRPHHSACHAVCSQARKALDNPEKKPKPV